MTMMHLLVLLLLACSGGKGDDSEPGGTTGDDSATDDSGTPVDDSASGCTELEWYEDGDRDGYGAGPPTLACDAPATSWVRESGDCDDSRADVHPDATEICNAADDDCDSLVDVDDPDLVDGLSVYVDFDGDGYGDGAAIDVCDSTGMALVDGDCDDDDADIHPNAPELCNGEDDDCDFLVDDEDSDVVDALSVYEDHDGDGYGDGDVVLVCDDTDTAPVDGDCDDGDPDVHPGAAEVCNRHDDDCDGLRDDDDPDVTDATLVYEDADGDGYGSTPMWMCVPVGVAVSGDCDDGDDAVHPDATEICNKVDDDCDKAIDDDDDSLDAGWRPDDDGDGYGDEAAKVLVTCDPPSGYVSAEPTDCDDGDDTVYPGAVELCDDVQHDCLRSGWTDEAGVATFYPAAGGWEDWTADMAAGIYGAPAEIEIAEDGELVICDGTWYAELVVGDTSTLSGPSSVTITGLHGSGATILSGGDDSAILRIAAHYTDVTAQGLTLTEGNSCFGAAISTGALSMCSSAGASIAWAVDYDLTLRDVRVVDNLPAYSSALAAAYIVNGNLTMEDTTIANNSVEGIVGEGTSVYCAGDPTNDAGVWGNSSVGVRLSSWGKLPLPFESDACDFDGTSGTYTPVYDAVLYSDHGGTVNFDFGDDADFTCDVTESTCL